MFKNIKNIRQNMLKSIFLFEKVVYFCINKTKQKLLKLNKMETFTTKFLGASYSYQANKDEYVAVMYNGSLLFNSINGKVVKYDCRNNYREVVAS